MPLKFNDLEMSGWWDSETTSFQTFVLRLLASLPGGDEAEDAGFDPITDSMGWQEAVMITEMLDKIEGAPDVEQLINDILHSPEDEDDYQE